MAKKVSKKSVKSVKAKAKNFKGSMAARSAPAKAKKKSARATPKSALRPKVASKAPAATSKKKRKLAASKPAPKRSPAKKAASKPVLHAAPASSPRPQTRAQKAAAGQSTPSGVTLSNAKLVPAEKSVAFAVEVARMLRDDKCEDVVCLDVRGRSPVTDYLVIGSGTSDRQMRSVLQHVVDYGTTTGNSCVRRSIDDRATWILADFVDVVVHLFEPNTRAHYDLEMLWGDSKRVAWERPDQVSRDYAGLNS